MKTAVRVFRAVKHGPASRHGRSQHGSGHGMARGQHGPFFIRGSFRSFAALFAQKVSILARFSYLLAQNYAVVACFSRDYNVCVQFKHPVNVFQTMSCYFKPIFGVL